MTEQQRRSRARRLQLARRRTCQVLITPNRPPIIAECLPTRHAGLVYTVFVYA
ncbi:uncharacterized, partial [Tachysurus ichikawai]